MRDTKRRDRILTRLWRYWRKNPDQRFYQVLINLGLLPDGGSWNIEDDEVEKHLDSACEVGLANMKLIKAWPEDEAD